MFYLIPDWSKTSSDIFEFDETVHQIQMFSAQNVVAELIIPVYLPNLRYFLNKHGLSGVNYWSVFDEIQKIDKNLVGIPLKLEDLNFSSESKIVYTPTCVLVLLDGQIFSKVFFSEFGFVESVEYFSDGKKNRKSIFNDIGYFSSVIYYDENANIKKVIYFDVNNNPVIEYSPQLNEKRVFCPINQRYYDDIYDLLAEKIQQHLDETFDTNVVSMVANLNNFFIGKVLTKKAKKIIVSFFGKSFDFNNDKLVQNYIGIASSIVVDNKDKFNLIKKSIGNVIRPINVLAPYDASVILGDSQSFSSKNVFWYVNQTNLEESYNFVDIFCDLVINKKDVTITVASMDRSVSIMIVEKMKTKILSHYEVDKGSFIYQAVEQSVLEETPSVNGKNRDKDLEETDEWKRTLEAVKKCQRVETKIIVTEYDILGPLAKSRIVVDLNPVPNIFLQVVGISTGIPQINSVSSEYVINKKNGLILDDTMSLYDAVCYYLDNLAHWNESLVCNIAQIEKFSDKEIVNEWLNLC